MKKRVKAYNKTIEDWNKRQLQDINSIPFDELCTDLIITNSTTEKSNLPSAMQLLNDLESISIGLFKVPNQFDNSNTQEQFTNAIETAKNQLDCLLFMSKEASFSDLGFKEINISNESKTTTHSRN